MQNFYRNTDDTWVAGICGGLAKSFDIDPSVIRVLMALFCLSGWGIILYVVLWIVLPKKALGHFEGRRFYRDMDNQVFGGVASGLADYFNWDVRVVRLVLVAPLVLSLFFSIFSWPFFLAGLWLWNAFFHGSIVGTFLFGYILLWIILPPSHKEALKDSSPAPSKPDVTPKTPAAQQRRQMSESIGQPIGVLARVFLFFFAGIMIFVLLVGLMVALFAGAFLWPLGNYFWTSPWQEYCALGTLVLFLGVPVVGLIVWLLRRAMGVKQGSWILRLTFGTLWFLGLASLLCLVVSIANDFRYYEHSAPITLPLPSKPPEDRLRVVVSEPALTLNNGWWIEDDSMNWNFSEEVLKLPFVRIKASKSPDDAFHVSITKFSAGKNKEDAKQRADEVQYNASYKDGVLDLGSGLSILPASKYRFQNVVVDIAVPVGKRISFDASVRQKLSGIEVYVINGQRWSRRDFRLSSQKLRWATDRDYVMRADGELVAP